MGKLYHDYSTEENYMWIIGIRNTLFGMVCTIRKIGRYQKHKEIVYMDSVILREGTHTKKN